MNKISDKEDSMTDEETLRKLFGRPEKKVGKGYTRSPFYKRRLRNGSVIRKRFNLAGLRK